MATVIGVDVGGTNTRAGILNNARVIHEVAIPTSKKSAHTVIKGILHCIGSLDKKPVSIGIGAPGPLDPVSGVVMRTPHLPLRNCNLRKAIEKQFPHTPVVVANDAECFSVAQYTKYPLPVLIGITIGTGLGSGCLIDGVVFRGARFAPELGHIPYKSPFRNTVIAEDAISAQGILSLAHLEGLDVDDVEFLYKLAHTNKKAQKVFHMFGTECAEVLATIVSLYDPDGIVIGGQISKAWKFFSESIRSQINTHTPFSMRKIVKNTIKQPGVLGAALLAEQMVRIR